MDLCSKLNGLSAVSRTANYDETVPNQQVSSSQVRIDFSLETRVGLKGKARSNLSLRSASG